jgi:hypothetical protein
MTVVNTIPELELVLSRVHMYYMTKPVPALTTLLKMYNQGGGSFFCTDALWMPTRKGAFQLVLWNGQIIERSML